VLPATIYLPVNDLPPQNRVVARPETRRKLKSELYLRLGNEEGLLRASPSATLPSEGQLASGSYRKRSPREELINDPSMNFSFASPRRTVIKIDAREGDPK
jgi:hypothetical protein